MSNYVGAQGVYAREDGEEITHLLKNGHGDVVAKVTDGAVTGTYTYDAFGNEKAPDVADTNPFRYCGEYTDSKTRPCTCTIGSMILGGEDVRMLNGAR